MALVAPGVSQAQLLQEAIAQDRRLEHSSDSSARALIRHRWHWTLDESNPDRVGIREYARRVMRDQGLISKYARAQLILAENPVCAPYEALSRAAMSPATVAAVETVAQAHGIAFVTAVRLHPEEVREVREGGTTRPTTRQLETAARTLRRFSETGELTPEQRAQITAVVELLGHSG
jgi:hypothetical protein